MTREYDEHHSGYPACILSVDTNMHWIFRMYTLAERERLTPSPTHSTRAQQIVPSARYTVQPFLQDQLSNRLYSGEQTSGGKLELTAYEGDYSSSLLPYSFKSLPLQSAHSLGYYPEGAFASVTAGWGTRGSYPRKVPWSPRPNPTDEHIIIPDKDRAQEESPVSAFAQNWMESASSLKPSDSVEPSVYSLVCKRRRLSHAESGTGNSPNCQEDSENFNKDTSSPKAIGYYAFYAAS